MARTNMAAQRVKPDGAEAITLQVLRRERLSPHFARVTLGGGDIARFTPMGYDQWFRFFVPVAGGEAALARVPRTISTLSYARFLLTIPAKVRPVLRNYTVRAYRPDGADGPEIDVDLVLHGTPEDGTAGPAATWAQSCSPGDPVALVDEGISFNPAPGIGHVMVVTDESGLPAAEGVLASLPRDTRGHAVLEVPAEEDRRPLDPPPGVEVTWVVREDPHGVPGRAALEAATAVPVPAERMYGWVVGEQALPTGLRRHWVGAGVAKNDIMFCGYWRAGR